MPESVESNVFLFADDTKLLRKISCRDDALKLQKDINLLEKWSNEWLLQFHPQKCQVLSLGKFQNIRHTHRYTLHGHELEHVFEQKDLGVIIDHELHFMDHISAKVKTANSMMELIRRSFSFLDGPLFTKLYTAFVRPHLEYAQSVWSPHLKKQINMIEAVQRRATKLIDGFYDLNYNERLERLDLPSLAYRRARGDMVEVYKHLHTYDKDALAEEFKKRQRISRIHTFQLERQKAKGGLRSYQTNSFYFRAVKTWNELPRDVVEAENVNEFRRCLDYAWKNRKFKIHLSDSQRQ